jgi:hypothetical protein
MKSKMLKDIVTFQTVRRGNWLLKVSVYKDKFVLVVAQHYFYQEQVITRYFNNFIEATNFVEYLVLQE